MSVRLALARYHLRAFAARIVRTTRRYGGATARLEPPGFLEPLDIWTFPKHPARTAILPPEWDMVAALIGYIGMHRAMLSEPESWIGTWINPATGQWYLDVTTGCGDLNEARRIAREIGANEGRPIVAIYNMARRQIEYL